MITVRFHWLFHWPGLSGSMLQIILCNFRSCKLCFSYSLLYMRNKGRAKSTKGTSQDKLHANRMRNVEPYIIRVREMAFVAPLNKTLRFSFTGSGPVLRSQRRPSKPLNVARRIPPSCSSESEQAHVGSNKTGEREARVQLWREVEALKKSLEIAVNAQRFTDAARIRDQINSLSLADDYFRTETELKKAIEEERFAEAARLRDVLKKLEPPPGMAALRGERESVKNVSKGSDFSDLDPREVENWSRTKTNGIVVHVESFYMPEQSLPEQNRFFFGYKVKITNESAETCQLFSRHWMINSESGPETEVRGPGVVGRQPVLETGESFEYTSACPLTVPLKSGQSVLGSMRGKYHFCKGPTGDIKFSVDIGTFFFKLPFRNYRSPGPSSSGSSLWPKP